MLMVGGETWSCSAMTVNTDSMPPAPPSRCPVIDLVELTTSFLAWSPKASLIALVSLTSPSGVDVPCALRYCTWSALRPAERSAACIERFGPSTFGAVMWKASAPMPKPISSA